MPVTAAAEAAAEIAQVGGACFDGYEQVQAPESHRARRSPNRQRPQSVLVPHAQFYLEAQFTPNISKFTPGLFAVCRAVAHLQQQQQNHI